MTTEDFGRQVDRLVSENQHLRIKSDNDDKTMRLMQDQYDALSATVEGIRSDYERRLHAVTTERDEAVTKHSRIEGLLLQATNLVMQALRANQGEPARAPMPTPKIAAVAGDSLNDKRPLTNRPQGPPVITDHHLLPPRQ